ncbi:MAG: signal peptidase I, partial [Eubacterium sp.]|nr:signal peptidase I [Eubacterium sp.]
NYIMKKRKGSLKFTLGKKGEKKPVKKRAFKTFTNTFIVVFAAIILGFGVTEFCFQSVFMTGPSMENTISNDDELILNKFAYKIGRIHRNDIVAIVKIGSNDYYDIKRVVGLPGDEISVVGGRLVINGKRTSDELSYSYINSAGLLSETITLGEDEYFVIGDNTSNSEDSRFINYGNVQKSEIKGKVIYRIYPKEDRGVLK